MVVLIVESAPPSLRGELSKWMLEPKAGVYVGSISGAVRDLLWEKACANVRGGGCIMIYNAANEQGFAIRSWGDTTRIVEQWEGLYLVRRLPRITEDVLSEAPTVMRLWAKRDPFQPLPCHLVDVGFVALELLRTRAFGTIKDRFAEAVGCSPEHVESWLGYLVALHDWGKGWRNFQARGPQNVLDALAAAGLRLENDDHEEWRHEVLSRLWLQEHLISRAGWNRRSANTVGAAIASHHGRLGQDLPKLMPFSGHEEWETLRDEVETMVRAAFAPEPWQANFAHHGVAGVLLSGLIVWADWIGSNEELFPLRWTGEEWHEYIEMSKLAARAAVARLRLRQDNPWRGITSFTQAWTTFQEPRPIQKAIDLLSTSASDGLTIIEAPMGDGKTEAALYLATQFMKHGGGLYVALPTATTSNQMFERVKAFLQEHDDSGAATLQLVHGTSWLVDRTAPELPPDLAGAGDDAEEHLALDWFRPKKRSLLATYGVGTIDQALMSVLHVKHGFLRLFGLSGKVLVVDEVHAYDAYMTEMLTLLLAWCRALSIRVILLSATLPQARKDELIEAYSGIPNSLPERNGGFAPYPLVTTVGQDGHVSEHPVPMGERRSEVRVVRHEGLLGDAAEIAALAAERVGSDGCVCIIANTVGSAQSIYAALKRIVPDVPTLLFHGRFLAEDRKRIEQRALDWFDKRSLLPVTDPRRTERPRRAILVATQVVEQSLDLDFDEMISEIAPIDLLLQRCGRLQRHHRPDRSRAPIFHVAMPDCESEDFGASGEVYAPYFLLRTKLALTDRWTLPQDLRPLVEAVYGPEPSQLPPAIVDRLARARKTWQNQQDKLRQDASVYLIPKPNERSFNLERNARVVFEDDEGLQRYLAAKTRHGNYTVQTLLVERKEWFDILQHERTPGKEVVQQLMLRTANLPRWWFKDVEPEHGFEAPRSAPRWLPVERVLFVENDVWCGRKAQGKPFTIEVSNEFGVRLIEREDEALDAV